MLAFVIAGWWWGSARLSAIDASVLTRDIGASVPLRAEVTGPARGSAYTLRIPVRVREAEGEAVDEAAQLELPADAPPPRQGAIVELVAGVRAPKGPEEEGGFDEASYLHRRGMHVVLRADRYAIVGRRGGVGGVADRIRAMLATSISPGLEGERKALVAAVVLGEDEGLTAELRDRFRTSGLYHLLSVDTRSRTPPLCAHDDRAGLGPALHDPAPPSRSNMPALRELAFVAWDSERRPCLLAHESRSPRSVPLFSEDQKAQNELARAGLYSSRAAQRGTNVPATRSGHAKDRRHPRRRRYRPLAEG